MKARFNSTEGQEENLIITGNGQFVIAWDFNKVKRGKLDKYDIQWYVWFATYMALQRMMLTYAVQVSQKSGAR